jgi:hypothetical protein
MTEGRGQEAALQAAVILLGIVFFFAGFVFLAMVGNEVSEKGKIEAFAVCSELAMDSEKCRKLIEGK